MDSDIHNFSHSLSFQSTHDYLSKLEKYEYFTDEQIKKLETAKQNNHQINWISDDADVKQFYLRLKEMKKEK